MDKEEFYTAMYDLTTKFAMSQMGETDFSDLMDIHITAHSRGLCDVLTMFPADLRETLMADISKQILNNATRKGGAIGFLEANMGAG